MRFRKAWVVWLATQRGAFGLTLWPPRLGDKEISDRLLVLHSMMFHSVPEQVARFGRRPPNPPVKVHRESYSFLSIIRAYEVLSATHSTILEQSGEEGPQWVRYRPTPYQKPIFNGVHVDRLKKVELPEQRLEMIDFSLARLTRTDQPYAGSGYPIRCM